MQKYLDYCYHSHTYRCGHATGDDEEFVLSAIGNGFKILGFSDHIMLPGMSQPGMRGDYSLYADYRDSVRGLSEKYKGKIVIHLGFEAEWYGKLYSDYYRQLLSTHEIDYMILGQHDFIDGGRFHWYADIVDKRAALSKYVEELTQGMKSGFFSYVAHPDLFMCWYGAWDERCVAAAKKICALAVELDMPLEVNLGPSRWGRRPSLPSVIDVPYPDGRFWDIAASYGVKAIVGVDDHHPDEFRTTDYAWAFSFVEKHRLNYITRLIELDPK